MRIDRHEVREEALLLEVRPPVRRFLRRILYDAGTAEDTESETILTLVQRLRAGLEIKRPISFALQVAWSKAIEVQRRAVRDRQIPMVTPPPQPSDPARIAELRDWLDTGLAALKPLDRALLHLRYAEDLSYRELARVLGEPIGTIGRQLHEAKHALRTSLERSGGEKVRESTLVGILPLLRAFDGPGPPSGAVLPQSVRLAARATSRFTATEKALLSLALLVMASGTWFLLASGSDHRAPVAKPDEVRAPTPIAPGATEVARETEGRAAGSPIAFAVAGRVVDESDRAVAGATVSWLPSTGTPLSWDTGFAARPDVSRVAAAADGSFTFEPPPTHTLLHLVATAPGFSPAMRHDVRAGAAGVVLRMTAGLTIGGLILALEEAPVADATVTYHARLGTHPVKVSVRTDRDGRYVFEHLPVDPSLTRPDAGALEIEAPGRATQIKPVAMARAGSRAGALQLDAWLARGSVLEGTVRAQPSGAPIADATVEVWLNSALEAPSRPGFHVPRPEPAEARRIGRVKTDSSGRYRFDHIPVRIAGVDPGSRFVLPGRREKRHKRVLAGGLVVTAAGRAPTAAAIPLAGVDETTVTVDVELVPEIVLTGSIRDARGAPVAGAEVRARFETADRNQWLPAPDRVRGTEPGAAAVSDARGEWVLSGLPMVAPPASLEIMTTSPGRASLRLPLPAVAASTRLPDIVLADAHPIAGVVIDERGAPVAGAVVKVVEAPSPEGAAGDAVFAAATDREGRFQIAGGRAADGVEICVEASGFTQARVALRKGEESREEIRVAMAPERIFRGVVRSAEGKPVAGAIVTAMPGGSAGSEPSPAQCERVRSRALAEIATDASGAFVLRGLPRDPVWLWAGVPWPRNDGLLGLLLDRKFAVVVPEERGPGPCVVMLEAYRTERGSLTVRAVDAASKKPIVHDLSGSLVADDGMIGGVGIFAGPGLLVFDAIPAGIYRLSIEAAGHPRVVRAGVNVGDQAAPPEILVALPPGARLAGRVTHEGELPPGAIWVSAVADAADVEPVQIRCGEDGRFDLDGLAPGAWRIKADVHETGRAATMTARPADVVLEAGQAAPPLEMRLLPIERVTVRLGGLFADGDPPTMDKQSPRYGDFIRTLSDIRIRCRDDAGLSWIDATANNLGIEISDRDAIVHLPLPQGAYVVSIDRGEDEIASRPISSPGSVEIRVPGP